METKPGFGQFDQGSHELWLPVPVSLLALTTAASSILFLVLLSPLIAKE